MESEGIIPISILTATKQGAMYHIMGKLMDGPGGFHNILIILLFRHNIKQLEMEMFTEPSIVVKLLLDGNNMINDINNKILEEFGASYGQYDKLPSVYRLLVENLYENMKNMRSSIHDMLMISENNPGKSPEQIKEEFIRLTKKAKQSFPAIDIDGFNKSLKMYNASKCMALIVLTSDGYMAIA